MIWKTTRNSTQIPTKDGSLAARVDGDPHRDPLLLCRRFRGTMAGNPVDRHQSPVRQSK
jgi:hypothetical protein